nr:SpoIIE family protein phosphatase [Thermoflexibacter sp.]
QKTILPEPEKLDAFFDTHFSLYLPKDVVSGDFYWFNQLNEQQAIFAMVDCTGHGVPGAFMSMIGSTLLHEIINFGKITSPALILKSLDAAIRKVLKQKEGKNSDGMDMSLALFEKQHDETINIVFGGAKNNLYFCQNSQINTVNGDRLGIGGFSERERVFNNQLLVLRKNDMVYFSSDGFIDQHDSERRRLGSATFKILLQNIATYNINEQKILLTKALQNHQQKEEQRDDISVVGIRL